MHAFDIFFLFNLLTDDHFGLIILSTYTKSMYTYKKCVYCVSECFKELNIKNI